MMVMKIPPRNVDKEFSGVKGFHGFLINVINIDSIYS
jgi:hypothetical protein